MRPGAVVLTSARAPRALVGIATWVALAAVVAIGGCAKQAAPLRDVGGPTGGADFRDVAVRDQRGQSITLRAAVAGRPALVSFWAPWCAPCVKEQPDLERLARAAGACGGVVVAVAVGETPEAVADFARELRLTFPQLVDEHFQLADALGQRRIPTTVVLDRAAQIVFTGEALDARATKALGGAIAPVPGGVPCALR